MHEVAPRCRGLIIPIFSDGPGGSINNCSQLQLARAITQAVQAGAHIKNISGGQLAPEGEVEDELARAIQLCAENNVLIVSAGGNDGCECVHVPASLYSVLAVGAMNTEGIPLKFSNWGKAYQRLGILAPVENILGAIPSGDISYKSGTSYATPIVTGIIALFLSIQLKNEITPDPFGIKNLILGSAFPCPAEHLECSRFLRGCINIIGEKKLLYEKMKRKHRYLEFRINIFNEE
ncbi:S8 family serine peptidase [Bacillus thuringiensis]|nr:S8 family serine peptidase [Bacillus thuringiensis]